MNAIAVSPTNQSSTAAGSLEEALLGALGNADREPRRRAIETAASGGDPDGLLRLVADHGDSIRRNAAIEALSRSGTRSVPALTRALKDPDPEVVMFAAGIMGKTRDLAAVPHLIELLDHPDINVAQQAIESLGMLRSGQAVDGLVKMLQRDPWLRFAAVHALGEIRDPRATASLASLLGDDMVKWEAVEALGKIGSREALAHLARALRATTDRDAFRAYLRAIGEALHRHPEPEALRYIEGWAKLSAAEAREVHEGLRRVLVDADGTAPSAVSPERVARDKEAAAAVVHALRIRALYSALVAAGQDVALREVIEFRATSLGSEIVPMLCKGLSAKNQNVRLLACRCLAALGGDEAVEPIAVMLGDPEPAVRVAALHALGRLRADREAPQMVALLADEDAAVRRAAVATLSRLDPETVTLVLLTARPQTAERMVGTLIVMRMNPFADQRPFIERALTHESSEVRVAAVKALETQGGDVLTRLASLLDDQDPAVQRTALAAIAAVGSARARNLLLQRLEDPGDWRADLVRTLGTLGDPAVVPALVRQLGATDPAVRREAVVALGQFTSPTALRHIAASAADADDQVRKEVARLLAVSPQAGLRPVLEALCLDANAEVAEIARLSIPSDPAAG
jgi:HEAT repeat protein